MMRMCSHEYCTLAHLARGVRPRPSLGGQPGYPHLVVNDALPVARIAGKLRVEVDDRDQLISANESRRREATAKAFIAQHLPRGQARRLARLCARSAAVTPNASSVHTAPGARASGNTNAPRPFARRIL